MESTERRPCSKEEKDAQRNGLCKRAAHAENEKTSSFVGLKVSQQRRTNTCPEISVCLSLPYHSGGVDHSQPYLTCLQCRPNSRCNSRVEAKGFLVLDISHQPRQMPRRGDGKVLVTFFTCCGRGLKPSFGESFKTTRKVRCCRWEQHSPSRLCRLCWYMLLFE